MISDRKLEHLWLCKHCDVEHKHKKTGFEEIELIHKALPQINKEEINITTEFFGKTLEAPIIITGMTGGHPASLAINRELARAAEQLKIGLGMGSQRAAVENPELRSTYTVMRDEAPSTFLIGNIGAPQIEYAEEAAGMMNLDALAVHINPLQEAIQPEGDVDASNYLQDVQEASKKLDIPIIVKETGAGIKKEDAMALTNAGAAAIDVAGAGGTSWAAVETCRSKDPYLGNLFRDWGIPTAVSTVEVLKSVNVPIISSGGIRSGLDAAKALALGAEAVGLALPVLKEAYMGYEAVKIKIMKFIEELKVAMYLVGAKDISDLRKSDLLIMGKTREWLNLRGINTEEYARRSQL
jgi:isopentenyl-diphosphate delta-isomerase